ncbi:rhombotarget A [Acinetobacter sp. A1-4-2]|uniref:Rhombotarget A n=1 Tax=Acinetobacter sp. A1-4-2 TaxID=3156489 RepID=A0AAU7SV83_9GAMM
MLKRSIGIGMLCFAGHAYSADIIVNTTEDTKKDDKECSLREAIEYVNLGLPKEGFYGCGGENSTSTILLDKLKVYTLTSKINITSALNLKTYYETNVSDTAVAGLNNAIIRMTGQDQVFNINDNAKERIIVNIQEVSFEGCQKSVCADRGGILYNNENLVLKYVKLTGGIARLGGAIYNVGENTDADVYSSRVSISNSLIENNEAMSGGILYSQRPNFTITNVVFKNNKTTSGTANIFSEKNILDPSKLTFPSKINMITNSTFVNNTGYVVNIRDGIGLNNLTIVANTAGVQFEAPNAQGYMANSIVIGNPNGTNNNCQFSSDDKSILQNNLVTSECRSDDANYPNEFWTGNKLFAGDSSEGSCKSLIADQEALLCPYATAKDTFLGYIRPRILLSANNMFDTLILNKGRVDSDTEHVQVICEGLDQRDKSRTTDNSWCDRGAIEIIVPTTIARIGQDLKVGEIAKINILQYLGDSDLYPKEKCEALLGKHPNGEQWQDGCVYVDQTLTESKGSLTLDIDGNLVYTPNGSWRGADIFELHVVTSSTRFNENKKYLVLSANMVQEQSNAMDSKSVKTSGGAFGLLNVLALLGLISLRHYKK